MSHKEKIGIAVGIAVGVPLLILLLAIGWEMQKQRTKARQERLPAYEHVLLQNRYEDREALPAYQPGSEPLAENEAIH